jgi:tetratricopeptide (TPR) repeat protein
LGYIEAPGPDAEESIRRTLRDRKINLAVALSTSRRAEGAIPIWQELAEQYPDEIGFRIQLASCLLRLGRLSESRQVVSELDEPSRNSIHVQLMRAGLAIEEGNTAEALQLVREASSGNTQDPSILNRLGELFLRLNDRDEAAAAFKRSLALMNDNPVAHDGLAQVAIRTGRFAQAAEHAIVAVGLTHYFPAAHAHLGEALQALDKAAEAIAAFETALAMGYKPQSMHQALAILYKDSDPATSRMHTDRA